ncbi:antitoxin VbhA family protein [Corynebacterium aquatimens]|uniref:antitoxin VbhA family protein n=1 Tax=Corynebacterium TaxID=1716 RepID=UPI001F19E8A0|nr:MULTISPECIES: antitoxin VbhA family protein [Corynebacterium]QYH20260.1 antitoxin VbhA family protein [Corynebacterium aquatimens]UIZ92473.1 antitoxin VbhA family protein [Corynebacterium sp. CNCTC7651]
MTDPRNEDQKVAAVNASMVMAGQAMSAEDEALLRQQLRGEISVDEAILSVLESEGLGDSSQAMELRRRIAGAVSA